MMKYFFYFQTGMNSRIGNKNHDKGYEQDGKDIILDKTGYPQNGLGQGGQLYLHFIKQGKNFGYDIIEPENHPAADQGNNYGGIEHGLLGAGDDFI